MLDRMSRLIPIVSLTCLVACRGSDPRPDPEQCDPPVYDDMAVQDARPAPDGEGWCCPRTLGFAHEGTRAGGFATDPCDCAGRLSFDAPPCVYQPATDSHGCEHYGVDWSCVLDAGPPMDAGAPP